MKAKMVGVYSLAHFIVDLCCAVLVTNFVTEKMGAGTLLFVAIVLYNFFAFAVQLPIGIIADKVNKNGLCAAIGCLAVALGYAFTNWGILACIIAGIGNAMFHVGGGIDVLNISDKKASLSGIFVSTGAMGIFLGSKSASVGFHSFVLPVLVLIIMSVLIYLLYQQIKDKVKNEPMEFPTLNKKEILAIICFMITVVIRGYAGFIFNFEWKKSFVLALISIFAVVGGKMLGGIIGDRIGLKKISILSLVLAAILFVFAFQNSICGILAILCFNMTMPITLIALSNILNNNKGMAFGLLTVALFVGAVPVFFGYTQIFFSAIGLVAICMVSVVALVAGLKLVENKKGES